jgi:diguanylate cyclase (GGDEF)-like protein
MKLLTSKLHGLLGFQQQIALAFGLGIAVLSLLSSLLTTSISNNTVHGQLLQHGNQITSAFAHQTTLALLYRSPDDARHAARMPLAFPETTGVGIYTTEHQPLFEMGISNNTVLNQRQVPTEHTFHENADSWQFYAPVFAANGNGDDESPYDDTPKEHELIGYVQVVMSKSTLNSMSNQILTANLLVPGVLLVIMLPLLFLITNRVSRPLRELAGMMQRAELGETGVRACLKGPTDVVRMENSFNAMMSELETREQQLKRARDSALASAQAKGEFAASVSHELRTPMNGVMGMLELLKDMGLDEKQEEYLRVAQSSGMSLLSLIDDILDFSKLESGKMKLHSEDFSARTMLEDIVELLSKQASSKQLRLAADIDDQIPSSLHGDAGRIRQILINLVGNAIKFTPSGSVHITAEVIHREHNEDNFHLQFSVRDTGVGIPEEAQQKIFEAFTQADGSITRQFGGTGLGLAICQQLVALLGGRIGLESTPGEGSLFWFTVPLQLSSEDVIGSKPSDCDLSGLRVLIVDSEAETNLALCNVFSGRGSYVHSASYGQEALVKIQSAAGQGKPYDLVISETSLADMSGNGLVNQILEQSGCETTRTLLLLGPENEDSIVTSPRVGSLKKPAQGLKLQTAISKLLLSNHQADSSSTHINASTEVSGEHQENLDRSDQLSTGCILVAEDNLTNQQVALAMLERLGHRAEIVNNGQEAWERLSRGGVALILMDCHMPVLNGYEASQKIRNSTAPYHKVPIVAMTANAGDEARDTCLSAGMNDYIAKPLELDLLQAVLHRWFPTQTTEKTAEVPGPSPGVEYPVSSKQTLDREKFDRLRSSVGRSFPRLINSFLEDSHSNLHKLASAVDNKDADQIQFEAHGIKGSALNLGADRLAEDCRTLENMGRSGNLRDLDGRLEQLKDSYQQLCNILELELREKKRGEPSLSRAARLRREEAPAHTTPYIMIVDDERSARIALRGAFEQDGYLIEEFENGALALESCRRRMPDLILMDVMMPEMDGFSAVNEIRRIRVEAPPPILMLTALQDDESIERAFKAGATDYITKPINLSVLRNRVNGLMKIIHAERHIYYLAYSNQITGLPNRAFLSEHAEEILRPARQGKQVLAMLMIDIDRFKLINDTQGHDTGDILLKIIAHRIVGCVRTDDQVVSLGGDEFIVLLQDVKSTDIAARIAEKIRTSLAQPFTFNQQKLRLSSSIGISVFPKDGDDFSTLMKHADMAITRAKAQGGNNYQFYEQGMETEVARRVKIEHELHHALAHDELVLHYQPQQDLATGQIVGAEALIRWEHPQRGLLSPAEFVDVAESSGLIVPIGEWVIQESCRQLQRWLEKGIKLDHIAVNVSSHQLQDGNLPSLVDSALQRTGLPPEKLELELTESVIVEGSEDNIAQMKALKELGVSLAIDDFGTGYSSLSYLTRFPVDKIKLDRSFIQHIPDDDDSAAIVSGIVALGHTLRLNIVAEGIETEMQKSYLIGQQCDVMQGYLLSRPLSSEAFQNWVKNAVPLSGVRKLGGME